MRYVIKNTLTGEYIGGESSWGRQWWPSLHKSKLFHRAADAQAYVDRQKLLFRNTNPVVIKVTITEVAE